MFINMEAGMIKLFMTLMRGRAEDTAEATRDRYALPLLRQQIREAAGAIESARRAVALAMAQHEQEKALGQKLAGQLADLEARAMAALDAGDEALAREAAGMIAELEAEADCSKAAQARFGTEVTRLRKALRDAEGRLRALQRGERLSVAVDRSQKLREVLPEGGEAPLDAAEATLARLTERQEQADLVAGAMAELKDETRVDGLRAKLAEAGHGPILKPSAESVLERLKQQRAAA
jgi:phage shock protein A